MSEPVSAGKSGNYAGKRLTLECIYQGMYTFLACMVNFFWLLSNYPDLAGKYFKLILSLLCLVYMQTYVYTRGRVIVLVLSTNRVYAKIMNNHNIMPKKKLYFVMHVIMMDFV